MLTFFILLKVANGPLVPRVLGCPGTMVFDPTYSRCVDDELRAKLREEFEREALWRATSTTPAPTTTTTTTIKPEPVTESNEDLIAKIIAELTPFIKSSVSNSLGGQ